MYDIYTTVRYTISYSPLPYGPTVWLQHGNCTAIPTTFYLLLSLCYFAAIPHRLTSAQSCDLR